MSHSLLGLHVAFFHTKFPKQKSSKMRHSAENWCFDLGSEKELCASLAEAWIYREARKNAGDGLVLDEIQYSG